MRSLNILRSIFGLLSVISKSRFWLALDQLGQKEVELKLAPILWGSDLYDHHRIFRKLGSGFLSFAIF